MDDCNTSVPIPLRKSSIAVLSPRLHETLQFPKELQGFFVLQSKRCQEWTHFDPTSRAIGYSLREQELDELRVAASVAVQTVRSRERRNFCN